MKKNNISLSFIGMSSTEVTNSAYLLEANGSNILIDYGLYQDNDIKKDYIVNKKVSKKLKPKKLDSIVISHSNADHIGKLPQLYKQGCKATIFVPRGNLELMRILLYDSAKIIESDVDKLRFKHNMKARPLYTKDDVETCLSYVKEVDYRRPTFIGKNVMFEFYGAGHIVASAQILISIRDYKGNLKRIGYTGDIGSPNIKPLYKREREDLPYCDVLIGESTYCGNTRNHSEKDLPNDINKIKQAISDTLDKQHGKILIPVFSLDRLQKILTFFYSLYKDDLKYNIYVDTPLGHKISKIFENVIYNEKYLWLSVLNWDKVHFIDDYKDSMALQRTNEPMIILASSGMMTQGRVVEWAKWILPQQKNTICFCGYSADNTLATMIKNKNMFVKVNGRKIKNKAKAFTLNSFSSHACHDELIEYYTRLKFNKLYLVHGNMDDRRKFVIKLENEFSKANKTSKVYIPNFETTIHL